MKLIKTNDGMIGLQINGRVIWCNTIQEATRIAFAHFQRMEVTQEEMDKDITYALDYMAKTGDTIAEFGVFGTFMYSSKESSNEF